MRFPTLSRNPEHLLRIPSLDGGINLAETADAIGENQLQNAMNLWWKDGRLCSRPTVQTAAMLPLRNFNDTQSVEIHACREEIAVGDKRGHHVCLTYRGGDILHGQRALRYIALDEQGQFANDSGMLPPIEESAAALYMDAGGSAGADRQLVMLDGELYRLTADGYETVQPYVPLRFIRATGQSENVAASIGGYTFESRNLLTDAFRAEYVPTEGAVYFPLPQQAAVGELSLIGTNAEGETVTYTLTLTAEQTTQRAKTAVAALYLCYSPTTRNFWLAQEDGTAVAPLTKGYVSLSVQHTPAQDAPASKQVIGGMTFGTWFGGACAGLSGGTRFFVSGNPTYPHLVHYSALNDPTYFPEYSFSYIGASSDAVTGFGKQGEMLVVFKKRSVYGICYTATALSADDAAEGGVADAETQSAVFAVRPLSEAVGCDCPHTIVLCGNRLVWANRNGKVYALAGSNQYSQYNIAEVGTPITPLLRQYGTDWWTEATAVFFDGHYVLCIFDLLFLLHGSCLATLSGLTAERLHRQFVWYRWKLPAGLRATLSCGDTLQYLASATDGEQVMCVSYVLGEGERDSYYDGRQIISAPLISELTTKSFDFEHPDRRKQVRLLTLCAQGTDTQLALTFEDEHGIGQEECRVPLTHEQTISVSVGLRHVRRAALRCRAEGTVAYGPCAFVYSLFAK